MWAYHGTLVYPDQFQCFILKWLHPADAGWRDTARDGREQRAVVGGSSAAGSISAPIIVTSCHSISQVNAAQTGGYTSR